MIDDFGTPVAEASFDSVSGLIETCIMDGEGGQQYVGRPLESILLSPPFVQMDDRSRARAEESLSNIRTQHQPDSAGAEVSFVARLVDPDAIDRKLSFTIRQLNLGRRDIGLLTVTDVTARCLAEDYFDHLSLSELLLVGVADAARGTAIVCKPGDLKNRLSLGIPSCYQECVTEILGDATDEKKDELARQASLDWVRDKLADSDAYSLVFACESTSGHPRYKQMRWGYLDREDETVAMTVSDVTELYSDLEKA